MADYDRRLQRLEERATTSDHGGASLMEAVRKRCEELLTPEERLGVRRHRGARSQAPGAERRDPTTRHPARGA